MRFSRLAFGVWFGLFLPPITVGAMVLAFGHSLAIGFVTAAFLLAWVVKTGRTTCRRCWAYGSFGCGLPSLVAPVFGSRLPAHSLSRPRILLQHGVDVSGAVFLNLLYQWLFPGMSPLVLLWIAGAWWLVGRRKRFHGLLPQLRLADESNRRVSLAVVAPDE